MATRRWRMPAPVTGQLMVTVFAASLLVALLPISTSRAAFVDTTANAANSAAAASCFYAPTVQSGTATNTANGTQTITISTVDPTKAFLLFSTRHNSNRPVGSLLGGQIASPTTIEFNRETNESSPSAIDIQWYVVEYTCGVSVQRGTVAQSSTSVDVAITPVAALDQAFVTYSKTPWAQDSEWGSNDPTLVDLTSTSNLQVRSNAALASHTIYWQVVEFTDPTKIFVQRGTTSIPTASTTVDVTLPASVDTTTSFALVSSRSDLTNTYIDETLLRTRLLSSTTLQLTRFFADNGPTEIGWQVIELSDGTAVQHGFTTLSASDSVNSISIGGVDLSRATVFAGTQNGGGQNGGLTEFYSDDIIGVASATLGFDSTTQISVRRNATPELGSFGWQVVEWGN